VYILLSEIHKNMDRAYWFYYILLNISIDYFNYVQVGNTGSKKSKQGVASVFVRRSLSHFYLSVNQYSYLMIAETDSQNL
jgi:hypothetical protein